MADQTIEIRLVLRDELSRQLAPVVAQLNQLANTRIDNAHRGFQQFGGAVRVVHRELSTLSRLTLGGIVGGGVIAGIVAATKAVGDMARQNVQLRYSAQSLGVSTKFIEDSTDALVGLGEAPEQAANAIKQSLGAIDDFIVKGEKSSLGNALQNALGGPQVAARLRQVVAREGEEAGLMFMINYGKGIRDRRGQADFFKQLNLPFSAQDMAEILPKLGPRVQLTAAQMKALVEANAQFERSSRNIGLILGSALTPAITKVMQALDKYLQSESGQKFAQRIREIATSVGDAIAKWIDEGGLEKTLKLLEAGFTEADKVIKAMGLTWPQAIGALLLLRFSAWLIGVAAGLAQIARYASVIRLLPWVAAYFGAKWFRDAIGAEEREKEAIDKQRGERSLENMPGLTEEQRENLKKLPKRYFLSPAVPQKQSYQDDGSGLAKSDAERRADLEQEKSERNALTEELGVLAYSVGKLNAFLPVGGPEGTAGSSGYGAGTIPNDLSPGAFQTLFGGGSFAGHYQTVVEAAQRHGLPPSLMASIFATETGYGKSSAVRTFNNPAGLMGGGIGNRKFQQFESLPAGIDKAGEVQKRIYESGGRAIAGMGAIYAPVGRGGRPVANDPNNTNRLWPGLVGGIQTKLTDRSFDPGGLQDAPPRGDTFADRLDPITSALAREGGGGGFNGSATVDIDVGGLGQAPRNPAGMFKPQTLSGTEQLSGVPRTQANPLNLQ